MLRRLVVPSVMAAAMMATTLGLGIWQLHRLSWKQGLLAEIEAGEARPPEPLTSTTPSFRRVVAQGRFLQHTAYYGAEVRVTVAGPTMGEHVIGILAPSAGPPLVVDRGWAPHGAMLEPPGGEMKLVGYVRPPDRASWLGARDDPTKHRFFALDPEAIGRSFGLTEVAPYTLVLLGGQQGLPVPAASLPRLPNNHLSYAATWFGLAAGLIGVFAAYVRQTIGSGRPA